MPDLISDIKGTLTNFKKHTGAEEAYFHQNAIQALMQIEGISEDKARARYEEISRHNDKKDPCRKKIFVPAVNNVAEIGYRNGDLSLENSVKDGVKEVFDYIKKDGARIILVGLAHPEVTRTSLSTVGLDKYIDSIYQSSEVGSKEDGTAFRIIAEREGLNLIECIYLDDKSEQAKAAHNAGVGRAIWILDGAEYKDIGIPAIEDFREIKRFYDEMKQ